MKAHVLAGSLVEITEFIVVVGLAAEGPDVEANFGRLGVVISSVRVLELREELLGVPVDGLMQCGPQHMACN